ncbi:MAG TPA: class I SAM-dependent methyltransferase [Gemmatimonadales bacterium]
MSSDHHNSLRPIQQALFRRSPWLRFVKPPAPTLNTGHLLRTVLEKWRPSAHHVLDLGCGARRLDGVVRCDLVLERPGVRADGARLPFRTASFDCVLATAVLEHVPHPSRIVREVHRVLRPNGVLYVEVPFLEGFHADPDDYQRFTFRGLDVLLRRFDIVEREVCVGPNSALNWILREYPGAWFRNSYLALAAKFVAAWVTAPIKYLDYFMANRPGAFRIAAGLSVLARRREGS